MDLGLILKNLLETQGKDIIAKLAANTITKDNLISWLKSGVGSLRDLSGKTDTKIDDVIIDALEKAVNELK